MPIAAIANAEAGSSVRAKLNQALAQTGIVVVTRSLADGAGTLTPDAGGARTIFILSGVASAPFDLTVSNGAVDQEIQLIVTGDVGSHAINAVDEELAAFSSLNNGNHITASWSTTWVRREFSKTWRPLVSGSGAPSGVVTPGGICQFYRDNTTGAKYMALGHSNTSWDLFESGAEVSPDAGNTLSSSPKFWVGTQTNYDLLTPDANTLYFILE